MQFPVTRGLRGEFANPWRGRDALGTAGKMPALQLGRHLTISRSQHQVANCSFRFLVLSSQQNGMAGSWHGNSAFAIAPENTIENGWVGCVRP